MAKSDKQPGTYAVGYRKPPMHSRFERGVSGNPNGRPKGSLNFATTLLKTLRETVVINQNGRRKKITKLEAAVMQLVNKAASGDLRALAQLIVLLSAEQRAAEETVPNEVLNELDKKVMLRIVKRYSQGAARGGTKNEKTVG